MTDLARRGAPEANLDAEGLHRGVGFFGLLWASEGSIIGSGWLFGALTAASIAGPSVVISWIIATVIVTILALVHGELGSLFPVSGGTSRFAHYAFGSLAGATFGWFAYIQAATMSPIEVLATIQYMSSAEWAKGLYSGTTNTLTASGIAVAVILMFLFVVVNLAGIRWLARVNNSLTTCKVLIPTMTIVVLLFAHFHSANFTAAGGFFVPGAAFKSILIAVPTGGIVFALTGFEQAVQLGGESTNPGKDLPRAVVLSLVLGGTIYILIQIAFIGALDPTLLAQAKTWAGLATPGNNPMLAALNAAPFYAVSLSAGVVWLAVILRIDAIVSPGGTGLIYVTTTSRISFGLSKNGYLPVVFEKNSPRTKVPILGILVTALIGLLFLLPFPSWAKLVGVVTSATVLMYAGAPLALGALRLQKPDLPRRYKLPYGKVLAPLSFVLANFIVYWAGWQTYSTLMVVMVLGFILIAASAAFKLNPNQPTIDWAAAAWIFPYVAGMGVISYLGGFGQGGIIGGIGIFKNVLVGGNGDLPLYWDLAALAAFSLVIYYLAMARRMPTEKVDQYLREVYPPPLTE